MAETLLHSTPRGARRGEVKEHKGTQKGTHGQTLHTLTPPHARTRTHNAREQGTNGGAMVKIGNIKVDLRSEAAALQERTRTHAHARAIGFYIHFPACCVCFFRVLLFAAS